MKILSLIPLIFSAFIIGCSQDRGSDFRNKMDVVEQIYQDENDRKTHTAVYVIIFSKKGDYNWSKISVVLSENFAKIGNQFYFSGTNMYVGPMEAENK